jgi:hypothetical protein
MTEPDANYWHLQGLIGGDTRWRRHIEQSEVLGVRWDKLPKRFKQRWWKATEWGQHPPSPEDLARLPELLAVDQAELENDKREIATDTAWGVERSRQAQARRPCELCLRPASPCQERCLRLMLLPTWETSTDARPPTIPDRARLQWR